MPSCLQLIAISRRTTVLPYDGRMDGFAAGPFPDNGRLPLISNADACHFLCRNAAFGQHFGQHTILGGPDLFRVMLYPTRLGIILTEFFLSHLEDPAVL